ncbi:DUF6161 domain-containing protein [Aquimarina muelleri]|uniref:DUF6161 domain-containing protein n=1 Tax=Aquimarina muelleri TaxID=279356 RepID=A0A918N521_9FLAO|nr:DUF6161 domain-containing protein [Aquimarina muelleri]MCX2764941.1 DUF6161 domain-containing protein [Aquimarina muelleri]GGX33809.1 hypothetical protein GCM10007384_38110 [Aquimarina muelleri]
MNVTEIRKLIRQSEDKSWYNSVSIEVFYPQANFEIELSGLDTIYQFFKKQHEYFNNIEPLPQIFDQSKSHFKQSINEIETYTTRSLITKVGNVKGEWNQLKIFLEKNSQNNTHFFNKESATTDFLLKLDSEFVGASNGAFDFLMDQNFKYNYFNKNYFIGWHRAYEFFTQDVDLVKRRNNERQTLSKIRSEYLNNLLTSDKQVDDHIAEKEQLYISKEESISRLIKKKNTQYGTWKTDSQNEFSSFLTDSDKAFKELESIYKEKLKLEAPAKYWNDRAVKLKGEGKKWLIALISCSVIAILSLGAVLYFISDGTLKDLFSSSGSAIRWSIVFITFVSFLAFTIRIFSKLTFSSYHLVRDAEEREQLAYVFLALKKEKNIDPTEQHLIMQSLFSRADSGLLKDDASPTMPGGSMIEKIIGGGK